MLSWKPVEIDGTLFNGGASDLIGIEECTDYNLDEFNSRNKGNKHKLSSISEFTVAKKKKKKKKIINVEQKIATDNMIFSPSKSGSTSTVKIIENDRKNTSISESIDEFESWMNYGIPTQILDALKDLKFFNPTRIQALTLPPAIFGHRDILGAAETGSGKTLAFGIPILSGILKIKESTQEVHMGLQNEKIESDSEESDLEETNFENEMNESETGCVKSVINIDIKYKLQPLYALILTPTRELAMQVKNHLVDIAKYTGIKIAVVVGGMAAVKQERILAKGPEIVVATPGRLWELLQQGNSHLSQIENIRYFVIDETDRMLEKGHFQELHNILERINFDENKRKLRQNFVFSATLTLVHELPKYLKTKQKLKRTRNIGEMSASQKLQAIVEMLGITDPKVVDITEGKGTAETLTECRITCNITEKDYYLFYFLNQYPGRTLIFCNSIGCVKRLANLLGLLECHPLPLHASMQQRQRLKNLEKFRDTKNSILVATDVAARGLDIPSVEHVIHYQTPRTSESYVHRSGRTARASQEGITILLIEPSELHNYLKLCKTLGKDEDIPTFPVQENFLNAVKERVNLARELDELQLRVKKVNSEVGWFQKAAKDMDIIVDDFVEKFDTEESQLAKKAQKAAMIKRKHLTGLLAKPVFPKGFNFRYPTFNPEMIIHLEENDSKEIRAIDRMKMAMEELSKTKARNMPLFKPKNKNKRKSDTIKKIKGKGSIQKQKNRKNKRSGWK